MCFPERVRNLKKKDNPASPAEKEHGKGFVQFVKDYIYIPASIVAALILGGVVFLFGIIPTESMEPTYKAGSVFVGFRLIDKEELARGDTVMFRFGQEIYVKRVIGLPGETISFSDGKVFINGELYDESTYLDKNVKTYASTKTSEYQIPANAYFVMGDNRENSYDSRFWDNPFVEFDSVIAKPLFVLGIPFLASATT